MSIRATLGAAWLLMLAGGLGSAAAHSEAIFPDVGVSQHELVAVYDAWVVCSASAVGRMPSRLVLWSDQAKYLSAQCGGLWGAAQEVARALCRPNAGNCGRKLTDALSVRSGMFTRRLLGQDPSEGELRALMPRGAWGD